jgi:glucose-6-phosphate 1-epimerase
MNAAMTKFRGLDAAHLRAADGASAIVTSYGAHVVSWVPRGGDEGIFLSSKSAMEKGIPIRGGVPVVFPQFATYGALPHHGLVRTRDWRITDVGINNGAAFATFRIEDCTETRQLWPHAFSCELTVVVSGLRLQVQLRIANPGPAPLTFCAALHTYNRVADIRSARLEGLYAFRYRDRTNNDRELEDAVNALTIGGEVDRIYIDAPKSLVLREPERCLIIDAEGFNDVVVWNPWKAKCKLLADIPRDAYLRMLCIEAAAIGRPLTLAQSEQWVGAQTLTYTQ